MTALVVDKNWCSSLERLDLEGSRRCEQDLILDLTSLQMELLQNFSQTVDSVDSSELVRSDQRTTSANCIQATW
jgi:hypothetical protein